MAHEKVQVDRVNPERLVGWIQKLFPNIDGDKIIATIRTAVPVAVGYLITYLVGLVPAVASWLDSVYSGWQIALGAFLLTLVTTLYYSFARWVESKYPLAGKWLLGSAAQPVYVAPNADVLEDGRTGVPATYDTDVDPAIVE